MTVIWGMSDYVGDTDPVDVITHVGTPHEGSTPHSGRYAYGSGDQPFQHVRDFLTRVESLKAQGMKETDIAHALGLTTSQYRVQKSLATQEQRAMNVETARKLFERTGNVSEVGRQMGLNESSVRSLLKTSNESRISSAQKTADFIKSQIEKKGMIDVGAGVEHQLNVSPEMMKNALYILEREGYPIYQGRMEQVTNPGKFTTTKVICPPGTQHKEMFEFDKVHSLEDYISYDQGETFKKSFVYPKSMDSKRLQIRYAEDGGVNMDGVIEVRRGVQDLSLGDSNYAQVRILVDDKYYLKGMCVYADDLPKGIDVRFNTNKTKDKPMEKVLKPIKDDPDNPFGALIKERGGQSWYIDENGNEQMSLINKKSDEGDWNEWSKTLPSQFLSKQSKEMIDKQLKLSIDDKRAEFDEIMALDNPVVKRKLLTSFAEDCDSTAEDLSAAALPRQSYRVILPMTTISDNEVYAPTYRDGEKVALIRFPHGGIFEIPILTVNNKIPEGKERYGNTVDAIGISKNNADRLSGADFDGDTVMVIPTAGHGRNTKVNIVNRDPLPGLEGFDPKERYPEIPGMKRMTKHSTQLEMGMVSNLITDMTIKGANDDELAAAVRHSMVVIDAEKHHLNYKLSEQENGIPALKRKYQGHIDEDDGRYHEGASTIVSKAKSEATVQKRKGSMHVNQIGKPWYDPTKPEGAKIYTLDESTYTDKKGNQVHRTQKSTKMAETDDAAKLSSGSLKEQAYVEYANSLKTLANEARKESVYTPKLVYNPEANKKYAPEVKHLEDQYSLAVQNAPKEREAQRLARSVVDAKREANPDMTKAELKKEGQRALTKARNQVGAQRTPITINDREWEAIQAGAISDSKLEKMLKYTDSDAVRQKATPHQKRDIRPAQRSKVSSMYNSGYTISEIAETMGLSTTTVSNLIKGKE